MSELVAEPVCVETKGVLFDMDESDTWYCVAVIFLVNVAVYLSLMWWGK